MKSRLPDGRDGAALPRQPQKRKVSNLCRCNSKGRTLSHALLRGGSAGGTTLCAEPYSGAELGVVSSSTRVKCRLYWARCWPRLSTGRTTAASEDIGCYFPTRFPGFGAEISVATATCGWWTMDQGSLSVFRRGRVWERLTAAYITNAHHKLTVSQALRAYRRRWYFPSKCQDVMVGMRCLRHVTERSAIQSMQVDNPERV
jgi:hypothetical protein